PMRTSLGIPFPRARCTACWLDTAGARSRLAVVTLRSADNGNEPSKKTSPARRPSHPPGKPTPPADVPGRGPLWGDQRGATLLGPARHTTGSSGADRAGVHLSVWSHQSP